MSAAHFLLVILPAAKRFFALTALHKLSPFLPSRLILSLGKRANFRLGRLLWAWQLYSHICICIFKHHPATQSRWQQFVPGIQASTRKLPLLFLSVVHLINSQPRGSQLLPLLCLSLKSPTNSIQAAVLFSSVLRKSDTAAR